MLRISEQELWTQMILSGIDKLVYKSIRLYISYVSFVYIDFNRSDCLKFKSKGLFI